MGLFSSVLSRVNEFAARLDVNPVREDISNTKRLALEPPKPSQVRRTGYEYGVQLGGMSSRSQSAFSQERLQILTQLYQAYLTCPWVSGPIDLIARTSTAGGLNIVVEDIGDHDGVIPGEPPEVIRLRRLLRFTNPREDMVQLLRSVAIDLLLFGDAYLEVVYLLGEPVAMYTLDATTVTVLCDEHGEVNGYRQDVDGVRSAEFKPEDVIHISLDAPRGGVYGVSPAQKALLPVTAWLFTEATIKENFRRGDPPRLHVDLGSMKELDVQRWREQYSVNNLGPKAVGNPVVTTGGGIVGVLDPRKVQDYLNTSKQLRDEIISCFGTPPSKLGIIETGNIGAGSGEAQDKTFRVNTIYPIQALILEKLNYHIVQQGFGITGWQLEFGEIDMRDSKIVEEIRDIRLRNGSYTLNRYRDEIGEPPVEGGDMPILVDRQNLVLWSNMEALSMAGVAYKVKGTDLGVDSPVPGQPIALKKIEVPQQPQPPQLPQSASADDGPDLPLAGGPAQTSRNYNNSPRDALPGRPPKESAPQTDRRRLSEAWSHAYRARRKKALEQLPPPPEPEPDAQPEVPAVEPKEYPLPTDPYWDADSHNHNDRPDYSPETLGLEVLNRIIVNPNDVQVDHSYQRPTDHHLVDRYTKEPRQHLAERVGLLAIRSDGSMWAVDGQHHTLAARNAHINALTYQSFLSAGPAMEQQVYGKYQEWHKTMCNHEVDKVHRRVAAPRTESHGRGKRRRKR